MSELVNQGRERSPRVQAILDRIVHALESGQFPVPRDESAVGIPVVVRDDPDMRLYDIIGVDIVSSTALCGRGVVSFEKSFDELADARPIFEGVGMQEVDRRLAS